MSTIPRNLIPKGGLAFRSLRIFRLYGHVCCYRPQAKYLQLSLSRSPTLYKSINMPETKHLRLVHIQQQSNVNLALHRAATRLRSSLWKTREYAGLRAAKRSSVYLIGSRFAGNRELPSPSHSRDFLLSILFLDNGNNHSHSANARLTSPYYD